MILASGDVGVYVDVADISMMPSVTDLAGLNNISSAVLRNAAFGVVGMAGAGPPEGTGKPAIALTMFGVTTPCVTAVSEQLRERFDCIVFHATGTGGRAMEKLVDSGLVSGVIDVTTTEICDHLFGGVLSAGVDRLGAIARTRVPYVGPRSAPSTWSIFGRSIRCRLTYSRRNLHRHNPQVTLMRTTAEENRQIGRWIAQKLNRCNGPVRFLIPEKGVSMLDAPGQPFHDPIADAASVQRDRAHASSDPRAAGREDCVPYQRPRIFDCASSKFPGDRWLKRRINISIPQDRGTMVKAYRSTVVNAPVQRVWAAIRDFNALPSWHPAIAKSEIEGGRASDAIGCVRNFLMKDGGHLREQLLALSDVDHYFTYNILVSPMPVNDYVATFRLTPITVGNRTFAEWWADFNVTSGTEQAMVAQIGDDVFVRGFEALEKKLAS